MAWTNPTANPPSSSSGAALSYYNGNVGIGTSTPSVKLSVVGDLTVSGTSTFLGNVIGSFTNFQVFDTSGTFNTTGKSKIMIEAWGGGGGGGSSSQDAGAGGTSSVSRNASDPIGSGILISATGGTGSPTYAGGTSTATENITGTAGEQSGVTSPGSDAPRGGGGGRSYGAVGRVPGGGGYGQYGAIGGASSGYGKQIFTNGINYTMSSNYPLTVTRGDGGTPGTGAYSGAAGRVVIWW